MDYITERLIKCITFEEFKNIILEEKLDFNYCNNDGSSLLHMAIFIESEEAVRFVLENGGNVNHVDKYGHTAVFWAIEFNYPEICFILRDYGADINENHRYFEDLCASSDGYEILKLIKHYS